MRRCVLAVLALLLPSQVAAQEPVTAGSGVGEAFEGCRTDLALLNQLFGWQVRWPRTWGALGQASDDEIRAAIATWRTAPAALDADLAALRADQNRAPAVVVTRVLTQLRDLLDSRRDGAPPLRADAPPELRAQWDALFRDQLIPAIARYEQFLRTDYRPSPTAGLGDPDCFRAMVRQFTSLDTPADEIEATGHRLLAETRADLALLYGAAPAEVPALLARLRTERDPAFTREDLFALSRTALARSEAAMPRMFSRPLAIPLAVEAMPRQMEESLPAGFYQPREDGSGGTYVINLSRAAERRLMAEAIAFHEGLPGHHLITALGAPRGTFNSGFLEGWAIYAEYLADEMGLYGSPRDRAGMMAKHLWAASRLVVEPGLHLHGWTRDQAIAFMRENTALSDDEIALEVDRYIAMPAQSLAYMLGYDRIAAARRYAEGLLGDRFDLRQFHDAVLGPGSRSLAQMHADVVQWADRRQREG